MFKTIPHIKSLFTLVVIFLLLLISKTGFSQLDEDEAICFFVYHFAKNIEWNNENDHNDFKISVITEDEIFIDKFKKIIQKQTLKEKPIKITFLTTYSEIENTRLIYVANDKEYLIPSISNKIQRKHILLITNEYYDKKIIMINLFKTNEEKINFEVNKANILIQDLMILPDLLLGGGTEIDIAELYRESIIELQESEKRLDSVRQIQNAFQTQIETSKEILLEKEKLLAQQQTHIDLQKEQLQLSQNKNDSLITNNNSMILNIAKIMRLLTKMKDSIRLQESHFLKKNLILKEKEQEITTNLNIISEQEEQMKLQDKAMRKQKNNLFLQGKKIQLQKKFLFTLILAILIVVLAIILIALAYTNKKKLNLKLKRNTVKLNESLNEIQTTQEQLEWAVRETNKANTAKTEFIANMSHELRTPLNAIIGFSQILIKNENLTQKQRDQISTINKSGEHLYSMINDILDYGKIETGKMHNESEVVDLYSVIKQSYSILKIKAEQKKINLHLEQNKNTPEFVISNQRVLTQIFINILGNAIKYTLKGNIYFRTWLANENTKDFVYFEIEDTGIGIPEDRLGDIFMPFVQVADGSRNIEGTGLGLAIVGEQIKNMGGTIMVKSKIDIGSTFTIKMPFEISEKGNISTNTLQNEAIIGYQGKRKKILIVDDNKSNCDLLEDLLSDLDFETSIAINGKEALLIMEHNYAPIVLLDLAMPILDGYETAVLLRKKYKKIKIIGISAFSYEKKRRQNFIDICDDFYNKPIMIPEILASIKKHLNIEWLKKGTGIGTAIGIEKITDFPKQEKIDKILQALEYGDYDQIEQILEKLIAKNINFIPFKTKIDKFISNFADKKLKEFLKIR